MNKRRRIFISLLVIVFSLQIACSISIPGIKSVRGSGDLITESRSVSGFDRVDLSGSGEVIFTQGDEESLTIETDDNIMEYVSSDVRGSTLYLSFDTEGITSISPTRLKFTLNLINLEDIDITGSGDVTSARLHTESLNVNISGSGDVQIDSLEADSLEAHITGSGKIDLAGEASLQEIDISGSGKFRGEDLQGETVEVTITGSGDATVWAINSLDVRISGSGSVNYYGKPTISTSNSGSGDINRLGDK